MGDFSSRLDVEQHEDKKFVLKYWLESKSGPLGSTPVFTIEELDVKGAAAAGFMRVQQAFMRDGGAPNTYAFVWALEDDTVKVTVRAYQGLGDQEVDNPAKRIFEDSEDLTVNSALNKGKVVFKVKPPATVSEAKITAFQGTSKGKGEQLPGAQGSWHKLSVKDMQKYLADGKVFTPKQPVTLGWQIEGADAVLVDLDLAPAEGLGKLDIPAGEKDRRAYLTKLTRDGDGNAQLDWLHTNTKAGGGLFVDLNIYDPAKPDKPIATWVVGGYPKYPPPQIVSFAANAPGEGQTVKPGGTIGIDWEVSDTAFGCSFYVAVADDAGNVLDQIKLKDHSAGPNKGHKDLVLDAARYSAGKKLKVSAALLTTKENRRGSVPKQFDVDGEGSLAAPASAAFGISVVPDIKPAVTPPFVYTKIPGGIRDMWVAEDWKPSSTTGLTGTQANNIVNQTYAHLNDQLLAYMGGPPWVANWFTFGKWASREAGQGIKNLAAGASAMQDLIPDAVDIAVIIGGPPGSSGIYAARHAKQFTVLATVIADDSGGMFLQVIHLFFTTIGMPVPTAADVSSTIWQAKFVFALAMHKGAVVEVWKKMVALLGALVHGNQGIYRNMAWATEVFCDGESAGAGQGLQKLDDWCAAASAAAPRDLHPRDPQRFLRDSFKMYKQCRDLWVQSLSEPDATKKKALLDQRRQLAHLANVTIGCQEQMLILQSPAVFSHPVVQEIVAGQEGVMRLHDSGASPKRTIQLLPKPPGGNWADFPPRMGVEAGSGPVSVMVANPYPAPAGAKFTASSSPTSYVPRASRTGTIYDYFEQNVDDNAGGSSKTPLMTVAMGGDWDNVDLYPPRAGMYL